mgnify:CR=1 FL=1
MIEWILIGGLISIEIIIFCYWFLRKNKQNPSNMSEYYDTLSSIAWDVGKKLEHHERKLSEISVRMDIIETISSNQITNKDVINTQISQINQNSSQINQGNLTSMEVLRLISQEDAMLANEVKIKIGKSREHVSRLLKSLCNSGYLERDNNVRPFRYIVTIAGRELINQVNIE